MWPINQSMPANIESAFDYRIMQSTRIEPCRIVWICGLHRNVVERCECKWALAVSVTIGFFTSAGGGCRSMRFDCIVAIKCVCVILGTIFLVYRGYYSPFQAWSKHSNFVCRNRRVSNHRAGKMQHNNNNNINKIKHQINDPTNNSKRNERKKNSAETNHHVWRGTIAWCWLPKWII